MPLLTKRENVETFHHTVKVQQPGDSARDEEEKDCGYEDFLVEEYGDDSDMEGSIIHRTRPKKSVKAPALPQRSEKRASKILDTVRLELQGLDGMAPKDADKISIVQESDPHELYLSSEEDASLSDDLDDDDSLDFDTNSPDLEEGSGSQPASRASSRRKSQEDTARVVSFIVVKPQIINIFQHSPTTSPPQRHTLTLETLSSLQSRTPSAEPPKPKPTPRRPSPLKLYPSNLRRLSVSSMATSLPSAHYSAPLHPNSSMTNLPSFQSTMANPPPRKSSRLGLTTTLKSTFSHASHSFLSSDPFAQSPILREEPEPVSAAMSEPPKTPTSLSNWKRGFSRTLSKARNPSMGRMRDSYTLSGMPFQRPVTSAASSRASSYSYSSMERGMRRSETEPITPILETPPTHTFRESARFEDMRRPPPPPIPQEKEQVKEKRGFGGLGRRKTVKGRESR